MIITKNLLHNQNYVLGDKEKSKMISFFIKESLYKKFEVMSNFIIAYPFFILLFLIWISIVSFFISYKEDFYAFYIGGLAGMLCSALIKVTYDNYIRRNIASINEGGYLIKNYNFLPSKKIDAAYYSIESGMFVKELILTLFSVILLPVLYFLSVADEVFLQKTFSEQYTIFVCMFVLLFIAGLTVYFLVKKRISTLKIFLYTFLQ